MKNFYTGLVSVSFRKESPRSILEAMAKCGLSAVEWGSDVHAPAQEKSRLKELAAMQEAYGIRACSYGSYFTVGKESAEALFPYLEAARILGTDTVRLWAGKKNYEDTTQGEKEEFLEAARELAEIAEKERMVLCMECHNNSFTNRKEGALMLMEAVSSPAFRMYWQPNQHREETENEASASLLAPFTRNVHVFHWRGKEKYPLAQGKEIWKKYLSYFRDNVGLLLEFMPDGAIETLPREVQSLNDILEELQ